MPGGTAGGWGGRFCPAHGSDGIGGLNAFLGALALVWCGVLAGLAGKGLESCGEVPSGSIQSLPLGAVLGLLALVLVAEGLAALRAYGLGGHHVEQDTGVGIKRLLRHLEGVWYEVKR